jgi:hypothetical protein
LAIRAISPGILFLLAPAMLFGASARNPGTSKSPARGAVRLQVENAKFHVLDDVLLTVKRMDGWMVPKPGQTVSLDSKNSFTLHILSGETYLKAKDLSALLNEYLLPHAKTAIRDVQVSFDGQTLVVKGTLHKVIDVPFDGKGTVSTDGDGSIRVHFTELKVAGVLKKGLLDFLGLKLSKVAQPEKQSRFHMEGDDVILPVTALFPPPRVAGKLTSVRIEGDALVQVFGAADAKLAPPPAQAQNYIYFRGGRMKFGKLTMDDVDLELIDTSPSTSFDFSLTHYQQQLDAGYSKSLPDLGLLVYMPDYASLDGRK